jgi:hypothetical protein
MRVPWRVVTTITACALALALAAGPAVAAPADAIRSEIQAGGVPAPTVTVATPPAATSADLAALDADPSASPPSITNENLLSFDPTNPLPVVTVKFGWSLAGPALPGLITPPGGASVPTAQDAETPLWELQIMLAVKHEIARGTSLAGIAFQRSAEAAPYAWTPTPDSDRSSLPPTTMPAAAVEQEVKIALPPWASGASVTVAGWTGGERRVTVGLSMPTAEFAIHDMQALIASLMTSQAKLNPSGAGIGSVVLRVDDPLDRVPLVTFAGDADWYLGLLWAHPRVIPWVSGAGTGAAGSPVDEANNRVENTTADPTATLGTLP